MPLGPQLSFILALVFLDQEESPVVDSLLATGLHGVQTGITHANQAARDIVSATTEEHPATTVNLTDAIVELKVSEHQVKASAAVIKTADEVLGTLIDIKA